MPESCSNYPPTRSKVLQSSSDNPAFCSEKYPMNKFNTATNALTVASDKLTVRGRSENPAGCSEHSESRSEYSAGCSENSEGRSKNTQSVSCRILF